MMKTIKTEVAELEKLRVLLSKNAHVYFKSLGGGQLLYRDLSPRMYRWIDTYNEYAEKRGAAWQQYCQKHGSDLRHDAYDLFA